ncbi:MAG: TniQ family protein [Proteobacteria bacterium]|nr:TniQ family protein [Pseudomonadota bacterium]
MLGLICSSSPHRDESLLSFLCRLANLNSLDASEVLNLFWGASDDVVKASAFLKNSPKSWHRELQELRVPVTRSARLLNFRKHKYCPLCLTGMKYWRSEWHLMLGSVCVEHQIHLLDQCVHCRAKVSLNSITNCSCMQCNQSLAFEGLNNLTKGSADEIWFAKLLRRKLNGFSDSSSSIWELKLDDFHEVALRFGFRAAQIEHGGLYLKNAGSLSLAAMVSRYAAAAMRSWPDGFHELLKQIMLKRKAKEHWKISHAFGPIYRDIYIELADPQFDFVRRAFEQFIHENWSGPLAFRNKNLDVGVIQNHRWAPVSDVARKVGVDPSLLIRMADAGEIPSNSLSHASGRVERLVDRLHVEQMAKSLINLQTLNQVSETLAISELRVRQLIKAGLLVAVGGTPKSGECWWFSFDSLAQLTAVQIKPEENESKELFSLKSFTQFVGNSQEFVSLIRAVHAQQIHVSTIAGASVLEMGFWQFEREEIDLWIKQHRLNAKNELSVIEAASILGVKQEVAYALVRLGLLRCETKLVGRRATQWISLSELKRFQKHYCFGSELAQIFQTSPRHLPSILMAEGIFPAAAPTLPDAYCRQYVWQRSAKLKLFLAMKKISIRV